MPPASAKSSTPSKLPSTSAPSPGLGMLSGPSSVMSTVTWSIDTFPITGHTLPRMTTLPPDRVLLAESERRKPSA